MSTKPAATGTKPATTGTTTTAAAASSSSAKPATTASSSASSSSSKAAGPTSPISEKKVQVVVSKTQATAPKKVTTMKYDLGELKKIREFDDWVTEQLEALGISFEIDFDDISKLSVKEREDMIAPKIAAIKDQKKKDAFKKEFLQRADETCKLLDKSASKKASFDVV